MSSAANGAGGLLVLLAYPNGMNGADELSLDSSSESSLSLSPSAASLKRGFPKSNSDCTQHISSQLDLHSTSRTYRHREGIPMVLDGPVELSPRAEVSTSRRINKIQHGPRIIDHLYQILMSPATRVLNIRLEKVR